MSARAIGWVHVGDLHLEDADGWESLARLRAIVDQVERHIGDAADFLFLPGDNANHGTPDQYAALTAALAPLSIPWRIVPGDHDFEPGDLACYEAAIPPANRPEMEVIAGHRCLFLDIVSGGAGGPDFRLTMHHRNRIAGELARAAAEGQPPLVFMHAFPGDLAADGEAVARAFADGGVAFVDTGHTHYNDVLNDGRTIYAATRSTGQIEEDGGRPGFSFAAVHDGVPSWRFRRLDAPWPHVQIVSPCDRRLVTRPADPRQVPRPGRVTIAARVIGAEDGAAPRLFVGDVAAPAIGRAGPEGMTDGHAPDPAITPGADDIWRGTAGSADGPPPAMTMRKTADAPGPGMNDAAGRPSRVTVIAYEAGGMRRSVASPPDAIVGSSTEPPVFSGRDPSMAAGGGDDASAKPFDASPPSGGSGAIPGADGPWRDGRHASDAADGQARPESEAGDDGAGGDAPSRPSTADGNAPAAPFDVASPSGGGGATPGADGLWQESPRPADATNGKARPEGIAPASIAGHPAPGGPSSAVGAKGTTHAMPDDAPPAAIDAEDEALGPDGLRPGAATADATGTGMARSRPDGGATVSEAIRDRSAAGIPMTLGPDGLWRGEVALPAGVSVVTVACGASRDVVEVLARPVDQIPKQRPPVALGQDCHTVGAWPQAGIVGAGLGPNRNGCKW